MLKQGSIAAVLAVALLWTAAASVAASDGQPANALPAMTPVSIDVAQPGLLDMVLERPTLNVTAPLLERQLEQRRGFRPTVTGHLGQGTDEMLITDFEVGQLDPVKWLLIYDINQDNYGEYFWGLEQCHASPHRGGIQSLWAVGGGQDGEAHACDDPYPRGVRASALLDLDLSGFAEDVGTLDLVFDFFLNTRNFQEEGIVPDGLFVVLYPDASNLEAPLVVDGVTAVRPEGFFMDPLAYDLTDVCSDYDETDCYNLAGKRVLIEFLFVTQMAQGTRVPGGAFVDNIRLVTESDAVVSQRALPGLGLVRQLRD